MPDLGIYVHVPFCTARCGYCDFNTYVPEGPAQQLGFVQAALRELDLARRELGDRPVNTIFFGGGTPTLLGAPALAELLAGIRERFRLAPGAEVSTEANPESVDPESFAQLLDAGFTRVSVGMQSAMPHILATLERLHTAGRAVAAAQEARTAGFRHVSLDLIFGTPGESDADWEATVNAALSVDPDHISAYGLTVEPGTALAAAVRRGTLPAPDEDTQARRFLVADRMLTAAGLNWYEVSSWARDDGARCHHNIGYWRSQDWWGIGPGAHSHLAGTRWSNVLRPSAYAARLAEGRSPMLEREVLTEAERSLEAVMLGIRTREGLALDTLTAAGVTAAGEAAERGHAVTTGGRIRLTPTGRLLATAIARDLSA